MNSDSPELPAPSRLFCVEEPKRPSSTRTFSLGCTLSPVHISTMSFSRSDGGLTRALPPSAQPLPGTLTLPVKEAQQQWIETRRMRTAPDHNEHQRRLLPTAPPRCVSASELIGSLPPAMHPLPAAVRSAPAPALRSGATATMMTMNLSFTSSTSSGSCTLRGTGIRSTGSSFEGRSEHCEGHTQPPQYDIVSRRQLPPSGGGDAHCPRNCSPLISPSKCTPMVPPTRSSASECSGRPLGPSTPRISLFIPPLPSAAPAKAPTTLSSLSAKGADARSLSKTPDHGNGGDCQSDLVPRSLSPLEAYNGKRTPHRPPNSNHHHHHHHQCRSSSDDGDDGTSTPPLEADATSEDAAGGGGVWQVRRGKRVGRGFTRRSDEMDFGEVRPASAVKEQPSRLTSLASEVRCSTSSAGLMGTATAVMDRSRRTSISFNNEVAVADDDATKDGGLHQLCDTPHHQSLAQPPPMSLMETSYSTLSSTTLLRRDGVTYII